MCATLGSCVYEVTRPGGGASQSNSCRSSFPRTLGSIVLPVPRRSDGINMHIGYMSESAGATAWLDLEGQCFCWPGLGTKDRCSASGLHWQTGHSQNLVDSCLKAVKAITPEWSTLARDSQDISNSPLQATKPLSFVSGIAGIELEVDESGWWHRIVEWSVEWTDQRGGSKSWGPTWNLAFDIAMNLGSSLSGQSVAPVSSHQQTNATQPRRLRASHW